MGDSSAFNSLDQHASSSVPEAPHDEPVLPCQKEKLLKEKLLIRIALRDEFGDPYADCPYELTVDKEKWKKNTDSNGIVEQEVPKTATTGELRFWPRGEKEDPEIYDLELGKMDPIGLETGKDYRLQNLDFVAEERGKPVYTREEAISNFRLWAGLEPGAELDEESLSWLKKFYDPYGREAAFDPLSDPKLDEEEEEDGDIESQTKG